MTSIYDLSQSEIDIINMSTVDSLELAALITISIDDNGLFVIKSAEGRGRIADLFRKGPPETRGYEIILKYLKAAAETVEKCLREGDSNFHNMKP